MWSGEIALEEQTGHEDTLPDALKGAAVALGVIAAMPIIIPVAISVLVFDELKEQFKRCPNCGSRKLIYLGREQHSGAGCLEVRCVRGTFKQRKLPSHMFYRCEDCLGLYKKLYGSSFETALDDELANIKAS